MSSDIPLIPGERIREELKARGWTQSDLAMILGRPLQTLNEIIAGKRAITPETAIQLGVAFGTGAEMWMQLEGSYRLAIAQSSDVDVERRAKLFSICPIKDMERRNWIKKTDNVEDLERELLRFFEVDSLEKEPEIDAMPRKSAVGENLNPAQRAWSFRAKSLAECLDAKTFSKDALKGGIAELRELAAYAEEVRKVPRVLANAGIRFLVIEPLPKTRIDGIAFWLNPKSPVIALSLRYDRIDNFWQTLGHELSHIDHRDTPVIDTDLVGENRLSPAQQSPIELRADREAAAMWVDQREIESFIVRVGPLYSKARINQFANRIRIHPGIIVGQLQHRGEISYTTNREMLIKVREQVTREALTDGWGFSNEGGR